MARWGAGWRPTAVMFDLDGTLIQTEHVTALTLDAFITRWSTPGTTHEPMPYAGRSWAALAEDVIARTQVTMSVQEVADQLAADYEELALADLREVDGASAFVRALASLNVPMAVVTASTRSFTDRALSTLKLDELLPRERRVTDDDVIRSKPDPEGYLKAAERLGVAPSQCAVFEDSLTGTTAAQAAGCEVFGVLEHATHPEELRALATAWIDNFRALVDDADQPTRRHR